MTTLLSFMLCTLSHIGLRLCRMQHPRVPDLGLQGPWSWVHLPAFDSRLETCKSYATTKVLTNKSNTLDLHQNKQLSHSELCLA